MPGILTVGAVHIGNPMDMSPNIINSIINHDVIAVENIDIFNELLDNLNIKTKAHIEEIGSYQDKEIMLKIIEMLKNNKNVLLLPDRGTASFHDPGDIIVNYASQIGIKVTSIPGPNCLIPSIVISGLGIDKFIYGSRTSDKEERVKFLTKYKDMELPIAFLSTPRYIEDLLLDALDILGENIYCVICIELTTNREKVIRCNIKEMIKKYYNNELNGESVIIMCQTN